MQELKKWQIEIPIIIGGKEIKTGNIGKCVLPHDHGTVVGTYHKAGEKEVQMAVDTALKAQKQWSEMEWQDRASIFLKSSRYPCRPPAFIIKCGQYVVSEQECLSGRSRRCV